MNLQTINQISSIESVTIELIDYTPAIQGDTVVDFSLTGDSADLSVFYQDEPGDPLVDQLIHEWWFSCKYDFVDNFNWVTAVFDMSADEFMEWTVIRPESQPSFDTLYSDSIHCPENVLRSVSVTDNSEPADFTYTLKAEITTDNRMLFRGQTLEISTDEP